MKWTLVTGAAKHLGASVCRELAKQGYSVVVHYRASERQAQEVVEDCLSLGVQAERMQGDFSTLESTQKFIDQYLKRFSDTENLINNVGNYSVGSSLKTSWGEWNDLFQTNLNVPFFLTQKLLPSIKSHQGCVLNIGVAGLKLGADNYSTVYTMAKTGLLILTKSLALEVAPDQVRVNMVSPGYLEESVDLPSDVTKIPLQRLGTYQEVAEMIAYLLSDKARYITGQNIEIAGGTRL